MTDIGQSKIKEIYDALRALPHMDKRIRDNAFCELKRYGKTAQIVANRIIKGENEHGEDAKDEALIRGAKIALVRFEPIRYVEYIDMLDQDEAAGLRKQIEKTKGDAFITFGLVFFLISCITGLIYSYFPTNPPLPEAIIKVFKIIVIVFTVVCFLFRKNGIYLVLSATVFMQGLFVLSLFILDLVKLPGIGLTTPFVILGELFILLTVYYVFGSLLFKYFLGASNLERNQKSLKKEP